jgi:spore coat protein H
MVIKATVNKSDYDNMLRTYWLKEDIDADLEVDGVRYKKGEIAFRGTSTLSFPKKGFKIKFRKKKLYQGHTKRIDVSASYVDKSLIRERLSFDLFAKTSVVASSAWHLDFTILSKEGQVLERGLYTALDRVDKYFFRRRGRETGTLYKADGGFVNGALMGAVLAPQPEAVLKILYDKKETKKIAAQDVPANLSRAALNLPPLAIAADDEEEDYSDLDEFIRLINSWDANTIARHLDDFMDVESYLDWLAVNTLVQSNDTYHKNYFLHNRVEDDKWEVMPWDYDLTWGRNWNEYCDGLCDDLSEGTSIKGANQMSNRLSQRVFNNPTLFERLRAKVADLLETEFVEEKLFPQIDTYYAEITELVHQDTRKWPSNAEFDHERDRLKDWIRRRRQFLFKELSAAPPPVKRADTIVLKLGFNKATLVAGDQLGFEATVRNIGNASTGDTVGVAFLVDHQRLTFGTADALEPGADQLIKSVSSWTATPGEHVLTAVVDDVNRYPEISEDNNSLDLEFSVEDKPGPALSDVVVKDIAFERSEVGQIRLAALVANIGQAQTEDVVGVAFFVDDGYATFGAIPPLPAGESQAVRAVQTLSLSGSHKITALVDDVNRFPEEHEENNTLTEQIDFGTPGPRLADTIILNVTMGQGRFKEGDAVTFEAVVRNIGSAVTGDLVGVAFLVDDRYITFGTTAPIPPGETRNVRSVTSWQAVAGQHRLVAIVDDINRYPEISEANNYFTLDFQVTPGGEAQLPDSTVESIDFETDPSGQVVLTATVANIGPVPTPNVVGVAFFIDGQYITYGVAQPMPAGATEIIRAIKPLSLKGTHTITAIVDDVNRYDELSHQNNTLTREIRFTKER